MSRVSRKPSVAISAVRAPLRSMIAFVAKVVPWMITSTAPSDSPASFSNPRTPVMTPSSGAAGVVSTFLVCRAPAASTTTSVKVPPISTASLIPDGPSARGIRPLGLRALPEPHLLDLARAGHRELVDHRDVAGHLEARDAAAAVLDHLALGELLPDLELHEGDRDLGEPRVGQSDDRGHLDRGMAHEEGLDFHRIDVLPTDLQHVLVAADEVQVAVGPHHAHVARVEPPLRVEGPRRLFRLVVVARRDHVALHEDLPRHGRRLVHP